MMQVLKWARQGHRWMGIAAGLVLVSATAMGAMAQSIQHGRKWKPLPPTSHVVVTVVKKFNGKPIMNAAVVFHAVRDGRNDGNLEVKTNEDGEAVIDVIEIGSQVNVQVIANGFATAAQDINVTQPSTDLKIEMLRPRAQVSEYKDDDNQPAQVQPGLQEHIVPKTATPASPPATAPTTAPSTTPPPSQNGVTNGPVNR